MRAAMGEWAKQASEPFEGEQQKTEEEMHMIEVINDLIREELVSLGITDYAAIAFRDEEEILSHFSDREKAYIEEVLPQKINLYKKYISNIGFVSDIKIILQTFFRIAV